MLEVGLGPALTNVDFTGLDMSNLGPIDISGYGETLSNPLDFAGDNFANTYLSNTYNDNLQGATFSGTTFEGDQSGSEKL